MAKQLFTPLVVNGDIFAWTSPSLWADILAGAPSGWTDDTANPLKDSSNGACFTYHGQLWLRWLDKTGVIANVAVIQGVGGVPTLGVAIPCAAGQSREAWSNPLKYRGAVVWLSWPTAATNPTIYRFDGSTLSKYVVTLSNTWTAWSATDTVLSPCIGGQLIVHDDQLVWVPAGIRGRPGSAFHRAFKIDLRSSSASATVIEGNYPDGTGQVLLQNVWDLATPTGGALPAISANTTFRNAIIGGASHRGHLYVITSSGWVDRLDDFSLARSPGIDLRAHTGSLSAQAAVVQASLYGKSFRTAATTTLLPAVTDVHLPLLGARVVVVSSSTPANVGRRGTIIGMWLDGAAAEYAVVNDDTGAADFPALATSDTVNVFFGLCGSMTRSGPTPSVHYPIGGPASVAAVSFGDYLYFFVGVTNSDGSPLPAAYSYHNAPMQCVRWTGVLPTDGGYSPTADAPQYMALLDGGQRPNVNGLAAELDEEAGFIHALWGDKLAASLKHCRITASPTFAQSAVTTVTSVTDAAYAGIVKPGAISLYSVNEPSPSLNGTISYDANTKRSYIPYKLYTSALAGLSTVQVTVLYNAGDGWLQASPATDPAHTGTTELKATQVGEAQVFVHDVGRDLPGFEAALQYKIVSRLP
jgi:hypothetical protein